jgi:mxaJ protein
LLAGPTHAGELRVCADPNNLPFSNQTEQGFENKIATLLAAQLNKQLTYFWWQQRRGFVRNTLNSGQCDLITGTVLGTEMLRATTPYYRSSYVFVTRAGRRPISSLDDPDLRELKIGIQLVGADNPPPAAALARRGLASNVRGFSVYSDDRDPEPGSAIVKAVANGDVDIAVVWGPVAAYYVSKLRLPLELTLVQPQADGPRLPMVFDVTMGVRKGDEALRDEIDAAIIELRPKIDAILAEYGVPRLDGAHQLSEAAP